MPRVAPRQDPRDHLQLSRWLRQPGLLAGALLAAVLAVHLLPRIVLGGGSIITIHDCLDSDFMYRVLLAEGGRVFDYQHDIPELLGGIPRFAYPTGATISSLAFTLLPPFWAYVALEQWVHGLAFWGMYLLLRDHAPGELPLGHRLVLCATFAGLPFYVIYEASVAGQAALLWALLNLYERRSALASLVVVAVFPFMSNLALAGAFIWALAALGALVISVWQRRWHPGLYAGVALLAAMYLVSDFPFVSSLLDHGYVSQRDDWMLPGAPSLPFADYLKQSWTRLAFGQYHASSVHSVCLAIVCVTWAVACWRRSRSVALGMLGFVGLGVAFAFTAEVNQLEAFRWPREHLQFLRIVNIRFYWCAALLWFYAAAAALSVWRAHWRWHVPVLIALAANALWVLAAPLHAQPELRRNYATLAARTLGRESGQISYDEFVSAPVFSAIRDAIGTPPASYRILSVGMHPSQAVLNGFYAADGYHGAYPLAYKRRFRLMIAANLARDPAQRRYFDDWGSRAYAFIPHVSIATYNLPQNRGERRLHDFELDRAALFDLGISYVLSSYELLGPIADKSLRFGGVFSDPSTRLRIYLYRVQREIQPPRGQ